MWTPSPQAIQVKPKRWLSRSPGLLPTARGERDRIFPYSRIPFRNITRGEEEENDTMSDQGDDVRTERKRLQIVFNVRST